MKSSTVLKSEHGTNKSAVNPHGTVLRIERSSVHDGDGFRTVIFLKGCPLRCLWCSTPESQSFAIEHTETKTYGTVMSVDDLINEVKKDSVFYFHSRGGVTISGGEPLVQADFVVELLKRIQCECISIAIETCLGVPFAQVEKVLPYLNIIYTDLKHIDPDRHKAITGVDNACILNNLKKIDERAKNKKFVIRTPLIPGINDYPENLHGIGAFCATLKNLDGVQLLPYHRLGTDTYGKLGRPYLLAKTRTPSDEHMESCRAIIRSYVDNAC